MSALAIAGIGSSIIGGLFGSSAAKKQAKAIAEAARISQEAADQARQDVIRLFAPGLTEFTQGVQNARAELINGNQNAISLLTNATGQANAILDEGFAGIQSSILGIPVASTQTMTVPTNTTRTTQPAAPTPEATERTVDSTGLYKRNQDRIAEIDRALAAGPSGGGEAAYMLSEQELEALRTEKAALERDQDILTEAGVGEGISPSQEILNDLSEFSAQTSGATIDVATQSGLTPQQRQRAVEVYAQQNGLTPDQVNQQISQYQTDNNLSDEDISGLIGNYINDNPNLFTTTTVHDPGQGMTGLVPAMGDIVNGAQGAIDTLRTAGLGQIGAVRQGQLEAEGSLRDTTSNASDHLIRALTGQAQALSAGTGQARQDLLQALTSAEQPLTPYANVGREALERQASLSGLRGQGAFDAAVTESPAQAWLREQQERAVTRNAAATGGLGGGNVLEELQRRAAGRSTEYIQQEIANASALSSMGLNAGNTISALRSGTGINLANLAQSLGVNLSDIIGSTGTNLANLESQLGTNLANVQTSSGNNIANILGAQGNNIANIMTGTGTNLANLRTNSGTQIANALSNLTNNKASNTLGLGNNLANISTNQGANLSNLALTQGTGLQNQRATLATLLANIGTRAGTNQANLMVGQGAAQANGINAWGNALQNGIGEAVEAYGFNNPNGYAVNPLAGTPALNPMNDPGFHI